MNDIFEFLPTEFIEAFSFADKKKFISNIIMIGKFDLFEKFVTGNKINMVDFFTSEEILRILPVNIDSALLKSILDLFYFENGLEFFYNYAGTNNSNEIREIIFGYFEDNYGDVLFDNLKFYENMILPFKKVSV